MDGHTNSLCLGGELLGVRLLGLLILVGHAYSIAGE